MRNKNDAGRLKKPSTKIKNVIVIYNSNFSISYEELIKLDSLKKDFSFFIDDKTIKSAIASLKSNNSGDLFIDNGLIGKHGLDTITVEIIRLFAPLTSGELHFIIINEDDEWEAYKIHYGKLNVCNVKLKSGGGKIADVEIPREHDL